MSSRFGFVKVNKSGYFTGSRSIITRAGSSNYVNIQLMPRTVRGTFTATSGGPVVVREGDSVSFPAGGVVDAVTGTAYTGAVKVYATYLDPTDKNLGKYMPGDLRGVGKDGNETALQSFGMMAVEMEGDGGQKLQLGGGKKAVLTLAIPASLQATAPNTIPLWYFNDSSGRWVEEGVATRVGNSYVGEVAHFSFWNCDAPMGAVTFKVKLKDQIGNPLTNTYIEFETETMGTRGGYTDITGYAEGLIPKGERMMMQVRTECGSVLAGANVGPALTDQDLGTITVTVGKVDLTLKGKVLNCTGGPVDSGFVSIVVDGLNYAAKVKSGEFTLPVTRCYSTSTSVTLLAFDFGSATQGSVVAVTASTGDLDVGTLTACGAVADEFINFTFRGQEYRLTMPPDTSFFTALSGSSSYMLIGGYGYHNSDTTTIGLVLPKSFGVGSYTMNQMILDVPTGIPGTSPISYLAPRGGACTFAEVEPVGGYVSGTFSSSVRTYTDSLPTYPISGTFRLRRRF